MGTRVLRSRWLRWSFVFLLTFALFVIPSRLLAASPRPVSAAVSRKSMNTLTRGVQKATLPNGLTVLSKEIHTAPVVSVQVWYRVGSRNESPGQNGISHQLEHLLFKGTRDRPIQFGRLFSALGSASNAFTSYDMTAYFGTVSSDKLEALLTLEADRMRNALINDEQLTSEKRVVISELQGYENSPDYRLSLAVMKQAFPDRAYGLPVGGTKADVERFTLEQVRNYYQKYYDPANAVLVVAGDFKPNDLNTLVQKTFGAIPKARAADATQSPPGSAQASSKGNILSISYDSNAPWDGKKRQPISLKEPGSAPLIESVYPLPSIKHPDVPALDVMDVILSAGRNSRFYQAIVEPGLVSGVNSYTSSMIEPGWYNISATVAPGQKTAAVDQVLLKTLQDLRDKPVTADELQRAKNQLMATFVLGNRDIDSQASQLAYNHVVAGDYRYSDRYLEAIQKVTGADVQRVAQEYLAPERRTVGYFEPTRIEGQAGGGTAGKQTTENFSPGAPVDPAVVAKYLPPMKAVTTSQTQALPELFTLNNKLRVLLLPDSSSPTVTLSGQIDAGNGLDIRTEKAGLAGLTADTLMGGTQGKDALTLAKALEDLGAGLDFQSYREGVDLEGRALSQDLPVLLETLADVLQRATFPEKELELTRQQTVSGLKVELDDPARLGRRTLQQKIYPQTHPFSIFPTLESLKQITQQDVVAFYQQRYTPQNTVLTLVGDFNPTEVKAKLNQLFGSWQSTAKDAPLDYPTVASPPNLKRFTAPLPGKTQVVTHLGYPGINRTDPRFYAAIVLNHILGGDTLSSRLGTEIRDRLGLTYGIYSYFAAGQHAGPFVIEMQTSPEDAEKAIQSTIALLKQFREQGISEAELKNAKRSLTNSYPVELANPDAVAQRILSNEVDGLSQEEIRTFPAKIEAVTMEQVQKAIQDLIQPDKLVVVSSGPVPKVQ
jgi:zinc protease